MTKIPKNLQIWSHTQQSFNFNKNTVTFIINNLSWKFANTILLLQITIAKKKILNLKNFNFLGGPKIGKNGFWPGQSYKKQIIFSLFLAFNKPKEDIPP